MFRVTRRVISLAGALAVLPACQFCDGNDAFLPAASLDPPVLDLGAVTRGATCPATIAVVNSGNADLDITPNSAKLTETDGSFTITTVPTLVSLGGRADMIISYVAEGTAGERQGTNYELGTNDPDNTVLRGSISAFVADEPVALASATCLPRGAAATDPQVACEALDFAAVPIGDASTPIETRAGLSLNVTIVNKGNKDLNIQAATINGSGDFVVQSVQRGSVVVDFPAVVPAATAGDCGEPTGADNTAIISVKYAPTALGASVGSLVVLTDGAEGGTIEIPLSGQGSDINLITNPEVVLFGDVDEGATAATDVLVQNVGTSEASVNESCIDLEDDGVCDGLCTGADADATLDGTLRCTVFNSAGTQVGKGFVLAATDAAAGGDDEHTVTLEWSPTAATPAIPGTAVLLLKSNIRNNKVFKVGISGGNAGLLEVTSTTPCGSDQCVQAEGDLDDTTTWTGSTTLTLRNSGTASLTLGDIGPEDDTPPTIADDWTIGAPGTTTLAPGATTTIELDYENADASGVDGFNLIIEHNGVLGRTLASIRVVPPT